MKLDTRPILSKEYLYSRVSPMSIYEWELGKVSVGRSFSNPLRKDQNPSMSLFIGDDGHPRHIDYADDKYRGDAIALVMQKYGITYHQALEKIASTFGISERNGEYKQVVVESQEKPIRKHSLIQITTRKWDHQWIGNQWEKTGVDSQYWKQYGISRKMLIDEKVHPVQKLYVNRREWSIGPEEKVYGYWYPEGMKVYMPEREKEEKWLSSIPLDTPCHIDNLDKNYPALVVKSLKDYLVCKEIYPYCCYVQNESLGSVTEKTAKRIVENSNKVYYGGDSDAPGKKASYRITEKYMWSHINPPDRLLPKVKDWADWAREEGTDPIKNHLIMKGVMR